LESFLQIIGSIASIASIPLAAYFFLRQREERHHRLRKEICRTLSYQLGEGRPLSEFEIYSVIDSKCREHGAKPDSITQDAVVEDLVSETISNPMLDSNRKHEILENLRNLHSFVMALDVLTKHEITPSGILKLASQHVEFSPSEIELLEREEIKLEAHASRDRVSATLSTTFGVIAALTTIIAVFFGSFEDVADLVNKIVAINGKFPEWFSGLFLGMLSSIIAALITFLIKRETKEREQVKKEERLNKRIHLTKNSCAIFSGDS
jgi:hypothetical protein